MKIVAIIFLAFAAALPVQASNLSETPDESILLLKPGAPNQQATSKRIIHPIHKVSQASWPPVQPRIVGGNEVVPHSIPYQVGIYFLRSSDYYFCGGSLISNTVVLTAAHCVDGATLANVILGAHRIDDPTELTKITTTSFSFVIHQGWNSTTRANDIALVRLLLPAPLNAYIQLVKLPTRRDALESFMFKTATASGWGRTATNAAGKSPVLRSVSNPILSNFACAFIFPSLKPTQVCMSGDGTKSVCFGDSGGPLMALGVDNVPVQTGIASFILNSCESGYPQIFTRVGNYLDWLAANAGVTIAN